LELTQKLTVRQLTGLDDSHLVTLPCGHRLQDEVAQAIAALQADAHKAGFELVIASSFRSFARQLSIWNGKARGARPVHDDQGRTVAMAALSQLEQLYAILRYSAIPGTSRHHWGTDLDLYDAGAVAPDYALQLSLQEVATGGVFDPLHCWLDERIAAGKSRGFYRPYARDRGGVAPERWHLSYAPVSADCAEQLNGELLRSCWDCEEVTEALLLRREIENELPHIMERYVSVPGDWCARE
jgi:LAS superfamily LD-carboxypeptidase LdcB